MKQADFIIIGGGAAGLTLAAELSAHARVIVLEGESNAGYHASGRSAAVFVPSYGHGLLRELTALSRLVYDACDEQFYHSPLLSKRGVLRVVLEGGEEQHANVISGLAGIEVITPANAVEYFPLIKPKKIVTASIEPDVYDIDADALLQGAVRKAKHHGAQIYFGSRVIGLKRSRSVWTLQTTEDTYEAVTVINASGAWANQIAELASLTPVNLVPCRRSYAVLPLPAELTMDRVVPFTVTVPLRWYAKADGGRLYVSPGDEDAVPPQDAFADDMVIAEGLHRFTEDTGYSIDRVEHTLAGLRTCTSDEYPVVGFDPRVDGFFWLAGQAGFGMQCAPGLAKLSSDLLTGNYGHPILSGAFSIERMLSSSWVNE